MTISVDHRDHPPPPRRPPPQNQLQGTQSEFLKLFMAQLQNQDPMNPKDGSDMVAQLAQMSGVEQQTQTNTELTQLLAAQSSTSNASLSSLVGRQCNAERRRLQRSPGPAARRRRSKCRRQAR